MLFYQINKTNFILIIFLFQWIPFTCASHVLENTSFEVVGKQLIEWAKC